MNYSKEDPQSVQALFGRIAPHYDITNLALSMGLCKVWMARLVKQLGKSPLLGDLCGGTGEVALRFLEKNPTSHAVVYDFSPQMLAIAEKRLAKHKSRSQVQQGDCHSLPFTTHHFSTLSMAYGLRNLHNPLQALQECHRVLQPNGTLFILELTRPKSNIMYKLHKFYLKLFVPLIGKVLTRDKQAYCYLANTIAHFPPPEELEKFLAQAGFTHIKKRSFSFGIATLLSAQKQ